MPDIDRYKYKAEGKLNGEKFEHEGVVYAEHSWDAAELAEADVRKEFPGVILKDDEPERGVTSSPQVFVTRDIVNRVVTNSNRHPVTGALLRAEIPQQFRVEPPQPPPLP